MADSSRFLPIAKLYKKEFASSGFIIGPGIRIYYGKIENKVILLLCGGDKGSQDRDIAKAKEYLKDYQSREIGHAKK